MKKTLAALFSVLMMLGMFSIAASANGPGPNENNEKGLCTAYFNGQKNGHDKKGDEGDPPPFRALEDGADGESDGNRNDDAEGTVNETASDVFKFCYEFGIGGNPDDNGRFTCVYDAGDDPDDESDDTYTCTENDGKSNENGRTRGGGKNA